MILRPYQNQCIQSFYNYYDHGAGGHGIMVLPTAAGKSVILGALIAEICQKWSDQRIVLLSHVRELILQNCDKILKCWPQAPVGIYSAALGRRESDKSIVAATIQSVYKNANSIGHRDLLFIDECHLLQPDNMGMYGKLIKDLLAINPAMKICGVSATDYRLDAGRLTEGEGAIFDDIIIEITIRQLLDEGYLTPPISKSSLVQADLTGVKKTAGEFNIKQMAERFDEKKFISAALDSDLPFLQDRNSIALFCATLENAAHVAEAMLARGIACEVIDGTMHQEDREDRLERFRSGELRALASVGVITTGTDIPNMDTVVLFRATESPGLYQQIIGRGFRVMYPEGALLDTAEQRRAAIAAGQKPNFLVLDHGGNIERHGAITHVKKPEKKEKGARSPTPKPKVRICEICRTAWPLEIHVCQICQHQMVSARDATANLEIEASSADIMGSAFTRGEEAGWFEVDNVSYTTHQKKDNGRLSVKITYFCDLMQFNEYRSLYQISDLWRGNPMREGAPFAEVVKACFTHLPKPRRIQVVKNKNNYYEVLRYEFDDTTREIATA